MTMPDYWRKLEAEGRLKQQTWYFAKGEPLCECDMFSLRLTDEEREKLLYIHGEPEDGSDCGIAEFTNLDILGEE